MCVDVCVCVQLIFSFSFRTYIVICIGLKFDVAFVFSLFGNVSCQSISNICSMLLSFCFVDHIVFVGYFNEKMYAYVCVYMKKGKEEREGEILVRNRDLKMYDQTDV